MAERVLRVGVVGAGHIARVTHLPVLSRIAGVEVAAICDTEAEKAAGLAKKYKIKNVYPDLAQMLQREDLDIVGILTPPDTHVPLAIQTMEHGRPCLIEKPLATTVAEADRAISLARAANLPLHVIYNYSFLPPIMKAKSLVASGRIGKLVSVDIKFLTTLEVERYLHPQHWVYRLPGGIFSDIAPHLVMLLLDFLEGIGPISVTTKKFSHYAHIAADELRVTAEAQNAIGSFTLSFNSPFRGLVIDIIGTKVNLHVEGNSQTVIIQKPTQLHNVLLRGRRAVDEIFQQGVGLVSTTANVVLGRYSREGSGYLIKKSLDSIRNGSEYPVDIAKCREAVRVLAQIFSSIPQNAVR